MKKASCLHLLHTHDNNWRRHLLLLFVFLLPLFIHAQQTILKPFKGMGKYGLRTTTGKIIVHPKYDAAFESREGLAAVVLERLQAIRVKVW